jgi:hypothetical protein
MDNSNGNILQENYNFNFNNNGIDMNTIRQNIRYKLVSLNTQQNFIKWITQGNTMDLLEKLIEQVKINSISMVNINSNNVNININRLK